MNPYILLFLVLVSLCLLCVWFFGSREQFYDARLDMSFADHPLDDRAPEEKLSRYRAWRLRKSGLVLFSEPKPQPLDSSVLIALPIDFFSNITPGIYVVVRDGDLESDVAAIAYLEEGGAWYVKARWGGRRIHPSALYCFNGKPVRLKEI